MIMFQKDAICNLEICKVPTGKNKYSRVHISSDTAFLKIVKKPSIVQE